jgi:hypothetical protein
LKRGAASSMIRCRVLFPFVERAETRRGFEELIFAGIFRFLIE